jgi:ferredoxin
VNVKGVRLVYYSPTGASRKIAEAVAGGLGKAWGRVDLTSPEATPVVLRREELAVIVVPVYGGRVPVTAAKRLMAVRGDGGPAVILAVYGNRAFEDALVELKDIAMEQGFRPVAAAAFVGEHSFSTNDMPIARGRPDEADLRRAAAFGVQVKRKLGTIKGDIPDLSVPGNRPYKERSSPSEGMSPETDPARCILCGACAKACPTDSITVTDVVSTVKEKCTRCTACVRVCPTGARAWVHPGVKKTATWLHTSFGERKEPETFLLIN